VSLMSKRSKNEGELRLIHLMIKGATLDLLRKKYDQQKIASTLTAQGIRLYKSILSDGDFRDMLKSIQQRGHDILPFEKEIDLDRP